MSATSPRRPATPSSARFPGMRVCLRPAECPFASASSARRDLDLGRWERALAAALPGDGALVSALVGDIALLALNSPTRTHG